MTGSVNFPTELGDFRLVARGLPFNTSDPRNSDVEGNNDNCCCKTEIGFVSDTSMHTPSSTR